MILGHKVVGSGAEKVLILHDWFSDCSSYEHILPYMDTEDFTYVLVDLRGYGRSKEIQGRFDLEEVIEDIQFLIENFEWDKFHILSHSMSALIAQKLLIHIPEKIKSIIAITPVSASGNYIEKDAFNFMEDAADKNDEAATEVFRSLASSKLTDKFIKFKVRRWRETTVAMARIAYLIMFTESNFLHKIKALDIPMLIIIGNNDHQTFTEQEIREKFIKYYSNSTLKTIHDAGHFPMQETPILLASYINEFLKENSN